IWTNASSKNFLSADGIEAVRLHEDGRYRHEVDIGSVTPRGLLLDPETDVACARLRSSVSGEARGGARATEKVRRKESGLRPCQPVRGTPLLARQQCAHLFSGNCPIRVDSRFCRAHPQRDKSRRRHSHSTLEGRTELGRPFERRSPRSASNTS